MLTLSRRGPDPFLIACGLAVFVLNSYAASISGGLGYICGACAGALVVCLELGRS